MRNMAKNWKTSILGLLMAIFGVVQASHAASFGAAFTDPSVQIAMVGAALGFMAKDNDVTGTAANPRAVNQGDPTPAADPAARK